MNSGRTTKSHDFYGWCISLAVNQLLKHVKLIHYPFKAMQILTNAPIFSGSTLSV